MEEKQKEIAIMFRHSINRGITAFDMLAYALRRVKSASAEMGSAFKRLKKEVNLKKAE